MDIHFFADFGQQDFQALLNCAYQNFSAVSGAENKMIVD